MSLFFELRIAMPVNLDSHLPGENAEARIEIIPLIDIMFFLLASFMLVSLSMVNSKSVKVNLPTATTGTAQSHKNLVDVSVDKAGEIYLDKKPMPDAEVIRSLIASLGANPNLRVLISADRQSLHGDVIHALDLVRAAGIDKVAFEIKEPRPTENP
jgi:biopolymer transport protein ExbD